MTAAAPLPSLALPPCDAETVRAYLLASGDDNPLHHDAERARAAGFAAPPVPGMLIMGQMARAMADWPGGASLLGLTLHFLDPVLPDTALTLDGRRLRVQAPGVPGATVLRLQIRAGARLVAMGEAVIAAPPPDPQAAPEPHSP